MWPFSKPALPSPMLRGLPLGTAGEEWVNYLYQREGFTTVARNYAVYGRKKLGEIDIVCRQGRRLVLVEVKTRESERFMPAAEAVDWRKQNYLRRMAKLFLQTHPEYADFDMQIDIAGVVLDPVDNSVRSVKIIENAIEDTE